MSFAVNVQGYRKIIYEEDENNRLNSYQRSLEDYMVHCLMEEYDERARKKMR
jgi:hypothetical protein